jgi:hypothetical protein
MVMPNNPEHNDLAFHICGMWMMIAYEVYDFSEHTSVSGPWVETWSASVGVSVWILAMIAVVLQKDGWQAIWLKI